MDGVNILHEMDNVEFEIETESESEIDDPMDSDDMWHMLPLSSPRPSRGVTRVKRGYGQGAHLSPAASPTCSHHEGGGGGERKKSA